MLTLSSQAATFCNNAIMISGSARSGTTLVGKLIHSMQKVEYAYEPPMLTTLFALMEDMNEHSWKLLYEAYIYEEFFLNAIAGRAINCNTEDDSSIYKVKSAQEIEQRLGVYATKTLTQQRALGSVVAFKVPDIVYAIPKLKEYYPSMRVLIVLRDAVDTINSLLAKKWFSVEAQNSDLVWPFKIQSGVNVPHWVRIGDEAAWISMSELDRAAYYYIRVNESTTDIPNRVVIKYSDLMKNPLMESERIAGLLKLNFGEMTNKIIKGIARTKTPRNKQIISSICSNLRDKVIYYSSLCV